MAKQAGLLQRHPAAEGLCLEYSHQALRKLRKNYFKNIPTENFWLST